MDDLDGFIIDFTDSLERIMADYGCWSFGRRIPSGLHPGSDNIVEYGLAPAQRLGELAAEYDNAQDTEGGIWEHFGWRVAIALRDGLAVTPVLAYAPLISLEDIRVVETVFGQPLTYDVFQE